MHAIRNLKMCEKECLCLYVCPTGATDTETGQIDFTKCIGCGMCVRSCPSKALSLVPDLYPLQQPKAAEICDAVFAQARCRVAAESLCRGAAEAARDPIRKQTAEAMELSFRRQAEDLYREGGYMIPQSPNVRRMLEAMAESDDPAFPKQAAARLLELLQRQGH